MFGYVQCDIELPEELKKNFANLPPIFKNTNVGRHDTGLLMKDYAEKQGILCQPRKMLISTYFLENGILITPLLLFFLDLGLVCRKLYRRGEYTSVKCFNFNSRTFEDCGDGFMANNRKVLVEIINVNSTNRGFRIDHHIAATYEQTKKGLS